MFDTLEKALNNIAEIPSETMEKLKQNVQYMEVNKGHILTPFNSIENNVYFIAEGALRLYAVVAGKELTFELKFENQFSHSYESFVEREPSNLELVALEPCKLFFISMDSYQFLSDEISTVSTVARLILENVLVERIKRETTLLLKDYDERFHDLVMNNKRILERVPNYMIATYLNMTPETFSRVKKRNT